MGFWSRKSFEAQPQEDPHEKLLADLASLKERRDGLELMIGTDAWRRIEDGNLLEQLNARIAEIEKSLPEEDQEKAA